MAKPQPDKREAPIPPTPELVEKRAAWSNGRDPNQCGDTIGRLWAWGMLNASPRHDPDVLRDTGRAYASAWWMHYQRTAAASIGGYREMLGGSIPPLHIEDVARDIVMDERFRRMDAELGGPSSAERRAVSAYCVDQHGMADPAWLTDLMHRNKRMTESLHSRRSLLKFRLRLATPADARAIRAQISEIEGQLQVCDFPLVRRNDGIETREMADLCRGLGWIADHLAREKRKRNIAEN